MFGVDIGKYASGLGSQISTSVGERFKGLTTNPKSIMDNLTGKKSSPKVIWNDSSNYPIGMADWRVKVSSKVPGFPGNSEFTGIDGDGNTSIMQPLSTTGGVIFPITPQIQVSQSARYSSSSLTHSNYAMQFYEGSEVAAISINGEFPIQTIAEGQYLLAAIYFFRAATKMFWGNDDLAGSPPPMLYLSGYGDAYFPNVPCVLTGFTHTMGDAVDYIEVPTPGQPLDHNANDSSGSTRLPTQSQIQITLQPIYSRASMTEFSLMDLADGNMIGNGGGFL